MVNDGGLVTIGARKDSAKVHSGTDTQQQQQYM